MVHYIHTLKLLFKHAGLLKVNDLYLLSILKFCDKLYSYDLQTYFLSYLDIINHTCSRCNLRHLVIRKPKHFHYTYIHTYIHTYTHTHTHTYIYIYIYMHTYIHCRKKSVTYIHTSYIHYHIHIYSNYIATMQMQPCKFNHANATMQTHSILLNIVFLCKLYTYITQIQCVNKSIKYKTCTLLYTTSIYVSTLLQGYQSSTTLNS